jgi:hypothetical protein
MHVAEDKGSVAQYEENSIEHRFHKRQKMSLVGFITSRHEVRQQRDSNLNQSH